MKTNNNYDELIERYLDGTLSDQEREAFMEKMNTDPELAEAVNEQTLLRENWAKAHNLKKTREEVAVAIKREKALKRRQILTWVAAASVMLLFAIPALFYFNNDSDQATKMAKGTHTDDSTQEIIRTPQFKQAEEKAAYGIADTLKLIAPIHNQKFSRKDSIIFRWTPALSDSTYIVIQNGKSDQTIFKERILPDANHFQLEKDFLPVGEYTWQIQGYYSTGKFRITDK